jgi:small basic protein
MVQGLAQVSCNQIDVSTSIVVEIQTPKEIETMNTPPPDYLTPYVLIGTVAIVAAALGGLRSALRLAKMPVRDRGHAFWSASALLAGWFLAALSLSWLGFYRGLPSRAPTIQYGVLIPIVAGVALFWRWSLLKRIVELIPQSWIVSVQVYRALGLIFLVLYAGGRMPGAFAWPAGAGDVMVGLLAPAVGIAYARGSRGSAGMVWAWNLLGITDLVVAIATGFLTSPSPLQMLAFDRPNELINAFPLVMIPVFLVPLSVLLHLASLQKLRRTETGSRVPNSLAGERGSRLLLHFDKR